MRGMEMRNELPSLLSLARDHSEGARVRLAGKLADLFLSDNAELTPHEEAMVNEIIGLLVKTEDVSVRHELVQKFADIKKMPRTIAMNLACGAIDFARQVLKSSAVLSDDDLITVIETQSSDHACAVAARSEVTEAVADALVTTGSLQVMQIVCENLGAHLSPKAVNILSETARLVLSLQKPILERPELTPDVAARLYWWVAQDLRRHAIERFGFSAGLLDLSLAKAIDIKLNEHIFERHEQAAMMRVADWLEERKALNAALLPKLLRLSHFRLFNIVLARLANVDVFLIDKVVSEHGGRLLAATCRAIGIDKPSFVSIFLLSRAARPDDHVVHPRELSQALASFDKLVPEVAIGMIQSWKADPSNLDRFSNEVIVA